MIKLFEDDKEWERFRDIALSWIGTPFRNCTLVKNRGVDCGLLALGILEEAKIISKVKVDRYPFQWFVHRNEEMAINQIIKNTTDYINDGYSVVELDKEVEIFRGDIIGFKTTRELTCHFAIYFGDTKDFAETILHCVIGVGTKLVDFNTIGYKEKMTTKFRVVKEKI